MLNTPILTDTEAITAAALDYALSGYLGDAARMERALHDDLAKRAPLPDKATGEIKLHQLSKTDLVQMVAGGGLKQAESRRQAEVQILEIYGDAAVVRLEMNDWIDFLQLIKLDGRWSIINVLWHLKPRG
jgi:hypothetical protein